METLIELYGDRALENILGPEVFKPKRIVYLCPPEIAADKGKQDILRNFFAHRSFRPEIIFLESSLYDADRVRKQLKLTAGQYGDCVIDITGGTDAIMFAAGMFCMDTGTPAFTYSRRQNTFFDISNAPFADNVVCQVNYTVEDFFRMVGGRGRPGRIEKKVLSRYMDVYDDFFALYLKHRKSWSDDILYLQHISQGANDDDVSLRVRGNFSIKIQHGYRLLANPRLLRGLEKIGFIRELVIDGDKTVSFVFTDEQMRGWLRDVGSVLELYVYKVCVDIGIFGDVVNSVIVDWDGTNGQGSVSNEIDVVAVRNVKPLFISCKACEIKTTAINELAVIKERFGGKGAKAAIVTTEHCTAAARHRAQQLGIAIIDIEELERGNLGNRLKILMKAK